MASTDLAIADLTKLKVPDLKRELKNLGLNTTGNKNELLQRLRRALRVAEPINVFDLDEQLLNDDYDEPLSTNDSVIKDIDSALNDTLPQKGEKRKSEDAVAEEPKTKTNAPAKKVVLNRNTPNITSIPVVVENKKETDKNNGTSDTEKKVIKLSEISAKERLEMRAKKFDVAISPDAKKLARAERFGIKGSNDTTSGGVDRLKQRAERFGTSVSPLMSKLEIKEKLEKRKARFGETTKDLSQNEKAKLRLERFKQPIK